MNIYICVWFKSRITGRNFSGEQKVKFESPVPFSKCFRAKMYGNMHVYVDPQGCQNLLSKDSEHFFYLWAPGLKEEAYLTAVIQVTILLKIIYTRT